jgi:hypothetical protein
MEKYTTINILKIEKRKKLRELFSKQLESRKKQVKLMEELLINPIKQNIEILKGVLASQEAIERYIKNTETLHKRFATILKGWLKQ